jgi:hypothetical protein
MQEAMCEKKTRELNHAFPAIIDITSFWNGN